MYQCRAKTRVGKIRQECTPEFFGSCTESRVQQGVDDSSDLVVVLPDRLEPFFMRIPRDALETVSSDSDTVQFLQETRDLRGEGSGPFFSESLALNCDSVDLAVAAKPVWILPVARPDELVIRDRRGQAVSQRGEKLDLVS